MDRPNSTDANYIPLLLEADESPDEYDNRTISRGGEVIDKLYISLMGCMTPGNAQEFFKSGSKHFENGLIPRLNFIAAPPPQKGMHKRSSYSDANDFLPIPQMLIETLKEWNERLGVPQCNLVPKLDKKTNEPTGKHTIHREELPETPCTINTAAKQAYRRYCEALEELSFDLPHRDFYGSYARLPETAMRIAVLLSSLDNNNHIDLNHWALAQHLAEQLRQYLHELYRQVNISDQDAEDNINKLIKEKLAEIHNDSEALTANAIRSSSRILRRFKPRVFEDEILRNLVNSGEIKKCINAGGIRRYYRVGGPSL
jgi:hypothetical protein